MKKSKQILWLGFTAMALLVVNFVNAANIDIPDFIRETQKMSQKSGELKMLWWMPEEFWRTNFEQNPNIQSTQIDPILKTIRPYTIVMVVQGKIGNFGGMTYQSEDFIRSNTRLLDMQGKEYCPLSENEVDVDTKNLLQMMKPVFANMLGPLGQNMYFLVFPGKSDSGEPIALAKKKGQLEIKVGDTQFKWRLPLDTLLPNKMCIECKQECKGSWNFCPWCGEKLLAQK